MIYFLQESSGNLNIKIGYAGDDADVRRTALPPTPAALLLADLRSSGFHLWLDERTDGLVPRLNPARQLTADQRTAIQECRAGLVDLLLEELRLQAEQREQTPYHERTRFRWPDASHDCGTWDLNNDELKGR